MSTFVIGDVQGCYATLRRLVDRTGFTPPRDRLWFVGDLVNRGPRSLEVLRWVRGLGDAAVTVLGNHDLHLLAADAGRALRPGDTLTDVLEAPDRGELVAWLRERPLLHRDGDGVLVHAGLLPSWTADEAERLAREAEARLREGRLGLDRSRDTGDDPVQAAANAMVSLRMCTAAGEPRLDLKGPPGEAPEGVLPWFALPGRRSRDVTVYFGHWSALGLFLEDRLVGLDTGCVWGRSLTAIRLEDRAVFQEPLAD